MASFHFVIRRFFHGVSQRFRSLRDNMVETESIYTKQTQDSPGYKKYTDKKKALEKKKLEQLERQRTLAAEAVEKEAAKKRQLAAWKKEIERSFPKK